MNWLSNYIPTLSLSLGFIHTAYSSHHRKSVFTSLFLRIDLAKMAKCAADDQYPGSPPIFHASHLGSKTSESFLSCFVVESFFEDIVV